MILFKCIISSWHAVFFKLLYCFLFLILTVLPPISCFIQKQPPEVSYKKDALENFAKFTGKYLWQSLFFNKVAGLRSTTLLKNRLWHRCIPVNFAKFSRTPFLQNTSEWVLLFIKNTSRAYKQCRHFIEGTCEYFGKKWN